MHSADELSEYELQRLETIRQNALAFAAMGMEDAKLRMCRPKQVKQPKQSRSQPITKRSSRRLSGDAATLRDLEDLEDEPEIYRDPNDVSQMIPSELKAWSEQLREEALRAPWMAKLNEDEQQRLRSAQEWLGPLAEFTARFGGKGETTLSRANLKSVLKQIFLLVSGAGVTTDKREGAFAKGRPITLGIHADEVDALRAEAQLWMPQASAPADLVETSCLLPTFAAHLLGTARVPYTTQSNSHVLAMGHSLLLM